MPQYKSNARTKSSTSDSSIKTTNMTEQNQQLSQRTQATTPKAPQGKNVWIDQPCPIQTKRTYYYPDGTFLTKEGGTVSWRNNNEGNLRPGKLSESRIGVDRIGFAVFATPEDGFMAKKHLLFSSNAYKDLTLSQAIAKYAPASDNNDPVAYVNFIKRNTGLEDQVMSTYNASEQVLIMEAMKKQEGYKVGSETRGRVGNAAPLSDAQQTDSAHNNAPPAPAAKNAQTTNAAPAAKNAQTTNAAQIAVGKSSPYARLLQDPALMPIYPIIDLLSRVDAYESIAQIAQNYNLIFNPRTQNGYSPIIPAKAPAKQATTASQSPLDKLLSENPGVKTNQDLINLFYRMGGNSFSAAAAAASAYGVDINALTRNRQAQVSSATAAKASTPVKANDQKTSAPTGAKVMSPSYTPDLSVLSEHAQQSGYDVKEIEQSANYVAKYCTGSSSQSQCTRGTSLFLQLASYARGKANATYANSCKADLFGSANPLTNFNIDSSVAGEYAISSGENKKVSGKSAMCRHIESMLKKTGDFITFKYDSSQHIVFHAQGGWYSDFKQGTAAGCGNESSTYSNIHYFNR